MLRTVTITGSFTTKGIPVAEGWIRFIPQRCWVIFDNTAWACLAPASWLDTNAGFKVELTPTDSDAVRWKYMVDCPAGQFTFEVPWSQNEYSLKDLVDLEHRSG